MRGGNYGWNYREGLGRGPRRTPEGLTFIEDRPGQFLPKQYGLPGRMTSRTPWCAFQKLWDEMAELGLLENERRVALTNRESGWG